MSEIILQDVAFVLFYNDIEQQSNYGEQYVVTPLTCRVEVSHLISTSLIVQYGTTAASSDSPCSRVSRDTGWNTAGDSSGGRRLVTLKKLEV